jgi:serine/threonine protein kinase
VMIAADGLAKLIDFGIARHFQPLTNATMIGTQGYAPPEQYRGRVETRSDLYALGATMHHALSGRDPAAEAPFSFPPLRRLCPDVDGRLAAVVDQALAYDVIHRVADAGEFKRRLLEVMTQMPDTPGAAATGLSSAVKPQLRLPLHGALATPAMNPIEASAQAAASTGQRSSGSTPVNGPSAPTVLSLANEIKCPGCARPIPADSRFCSYCATDLRFLGEAGASASASPNAETVVLSTPHPSHAPNDMRDLRAGIGHRQSRHAQRHRGRRHRMLVLAVIFLGSFIAMKIHRATSENAAPSGYTSGSSEPAGIIPPMPSPSGDDEGGIAGTPRLAALREALDARGYTDVRFRMQGDTIILWGTVPTPSDHAMVQLLCATAGIYSLRDNLRVDDTDMSG